MTKTMMKRAAGSVLLALLLTGGTAAGDTVYISSKDGLRMRSKPTTDSDCIQVLPFGTKIAVIDDEPLNGWLRVEGDGYILKEYTQKTDPLSEMEYLGSWRITAYAETGWPCANGAYPTVGYTVACNSLPFGTEIYIQDVGFRTVEDRGPSWLGDAWCDLYLGVTADCIQWGDQTKDVYLVKGKE